MTASDPADADGLRDRLLSSGADGGDWSGSIDDWVAVLEFVAADVAQGFLLADLEALLEQLRDWSPSALWNPDRYAVQLHIPASSAHQALRWAHTYHRRAAVAAGVTPSRFVRAEIVTVEEFQRSTDNDRPAPAPRAASPASPLCHELYTATRRLLEASDPAGLGATVAAFVAAVGGTVHPGAPCHLPGLVDVDCSIDGAPPCHATAEALSVAGLIIEQSLPTLLTDVRAWARRHHTGHFLPSADPGPSRHI